MKQQLLKFKKVVVKINRISLIISFWIIIMW